MIINKLRDFNLTYRDEFGEMILCFDAGGNWRKDKYPFYKAGRKKSREESEHDWSNIFNVMGEIKDDIVKYTPYRTIAVEGAEADDIIGVICEKNTNPEPILIISPDKDFVQLQRYPNVRQYSNLQKKWVEPKVSAEYDLMEKVLKGDGGDGVPNVLSDDNTFINGERQGVMSKKKFEALMENPEALGTTIARRIIRNRDLVDLTRVPDQLKTEIMEKFEKPAKGSVTSLMTLFTKYQMKQLLESLSDFEVRKVG